MQTHTQEIASSVCVSILMDPTSWRDFGFNGTSWRKNLNQLDERGTDTEDRCWRTTLKIEVSSYIFTREQVISCDDHRATLIRPRQLYSLDGRSLWLKPDLRQLARSVAPQKFNIFSLCLSEEFFSRLHVIQRRPVFILSVFLSPLVKINLHWAL